MRIIIIIVILEGTMCDLKTLKALNSALAYSRAGVGSYLTYRANLRFSQVVQEAKPGEDQGLAKNPA